jgi:diguanylate cyclase (GGDEF)-like protein
MKVPARPTVAASHEVEHSLLLATLEATADGILVVDRSGKIVRFNERFAKLWKIPQSILDSGDDDQAIGYVLSQLKDPAAFVEKVRELYAQPEKESFDVLEFTDSRVFERYSIPQRADGKPVGRVWSFRDVTQRVHEERERAAAEARARHRLDRLESLWRLLTSVELTGDGLTEMILSEGRRALELDYATLSRVEGRDIINQVVSSKSDMLSHRPTLRLDATIASMVVDAGETLDSPDLKTDPAFADEPRMQTNRFRAAIATPLRVGDRVFVLGFGSRRARIEPFTHEDREYVELLAAYFGRLLRMNEQEGQITYLAYHDSLTGLENRRRFLERVEEAIARSRRSRRNFALMYIDLDRFKDVNDTLGHIAGDAVLGEAGRRLRSVVRTEDPAARFGGDEFAVLLTEMTDLGEADALGARILTAFAEQFTAEGRDVQISASIGIAVYPVDGTCAGDLLRCADAALYRAKEQGRRRFCYYSQEMAAALHHRRQLQGGLHQAIERNEFSLHYQPVFGLDDGHIEATEALLRWNHPERGIVFPAEFIPAAEETALMLPIGEWVIRTAARQVGAWLRAGRKLRMAVNISAIQLQDLAFIPQLKAALTEFDVPPDLFGIEITESAALRDPDAARAIVNECRRLGMRVALDDFGTHYASLSHLKKLPVDIIKVDKSFVRGLPGDPNDAAIVRSIIALGENFRCAVVAEGVENESQARWLRDNGCRFGQGFLLGKPLAPDAFDRWVAERKATD